MKKDFGVHPWLYPMPTYMIQTYNEDGSCDSMMMAWGGICAEDMVALNLEESHKTVENLRKTKAFTISVPTIDTLEQSDYLGLVSGKNVSDKVARTGLHAAKSEHVNAPIIEEYPLTLECEVVEFQEQPYGLRILGQIKNVLADESILDENGTIDPAKLHAFGFDQMKNGYYQMGDKAGQAWKSGTKFMEKKA